MPQFNNSIFKTAVVILIFLIFCYTLTPGLNFAIGHLFQQILRSSAGHFLNYQTRGYAVLEGESFIIKYQAKDAEIAPFVLEMAETLYNQVQLGLGYQRADKAKALLVIYPDERALQQGFGWEGDKSAVGVYWAGQIRILSPWDWLEGDTAEEIRQAFWAESPLAHEITHLLVDKQTGGNYTRWLTEGLAQYLERELTGYILDEPSGHEKIRSISLKSIEAYFDEGERQTLAYWQALQSVDYLIRDYGMEDMRKFLQRLGRGENFELALTAVYGVNLSELDRIMNDIYRQQS